MKKHRKTIGIAVSAFMWGVFTALILPITFLAIIEGACLIFLGFFLCRCN